MFNLEKLPYDLDALAPYMSFDTLKFHYGKHHQAYVDNLNKLIAGTEFENQSLEEIINNTYNKEEYQNIFNNAAQNYNHQIFWKNMSPNENDRVISENLMQMINRDFGSLDNFYSKFKQEAMAQFGSGWAWLVKSEEGLLVMRTKNAENPLPLNLKPLLALDVWEHSYYLDYQNRRADFVDAYLKNLVNWSFVDSIL